MIRLNRGFIVLLAGILAIHAFSLASAVAAPRVKHVFIISFDQGGPDVIRKSEMPVYHQMAAEGARTWNAYTIVPSITLPSHVSMLTGVGPQAHQVLWNDYVPTNGVVSVPTIFSLAKKRGLVTAMYVGKQKFKHLDHPGSLDAFAWPQPKPDARAVAAAFAAQVATLKPNVCFIHFADPDVAGHKYGGASPEKMRALADCDAALGVIKDAIAAAGLTSKSVIILTADHGSHDVKNKEGKISGTHGGTTPDDVIIPWIVWGKGVKKNFTITAPVVQYDTAATALWLLKLPVPESFWGRPVSSAFK